MVVEKEYAVQCFDCLRILGMCKQQLFEKKIYCIKCSIKQHQKSNINKVNIQQGEMARTRKGDAYPEIGRVTTPQSSRAINGDGNPAGAENAQEENK